MVSVDVKLSKRLMGRDSNYVEKRNGEGYEEEDGETFAPEEDFVQGFLGVEGTDGDLFFLESSAVTCEGFLFGGLLYLVGNFSFSHFCVSYRGFIADRHGLVSYAQSGRQFYVLTRSGSVFFRVYVHFYQVWPVLLTVREKISALELLRLDSVQRVLGALNFQVYVVYVDLFYFNFSLCYQNNSQAKGY